MLLLKRLRGIAGTTLAWGVGASAVGLIAFLAGVNPWPVDLRYYGPTAAQFAAWEALVFCWGAVGGGVFGLFLTALERSRRLSELSAARIAVWGAIAGAAFPMAFGIWTYTLFGAAANKLALIVLVGASACVGALWARGLLSVAQRGSERSERSERSEQALLSQELATNLGLVAPAQDHVLETRRPAVS